MYGIYQRYFKEVIAMRKLFIALMLLLVCSTQVANANFDTENFDWDRQYYFNATRLKSVLFNGEWDHSIYYFSDPKNPTNSCLVVTCHGSYDDNGYFIQIMNNDRHDYATALSETLAWHYKNNTINSSGNYTYVFLTTCYSGYAEQKAVKLPIFNINCQLANQNKYPNGFVEKYDAQGNVVGLEIWYATPRSVQLNKPTGNLPIDQANSKRGKAPEGLVVLSYGTEYAKYAKKTKSEEK